MNALLVCLSILLQAPGGPRGQPVGEVPAGRDPAPGVGIEQHLDRQVTLDLPFTDSTGREVRLSEYFGTTPVVLIFVYYECPSLCTDVLNGFVRCLRAMELTPGSDFRVLTVTIDPGETPDLAAAKKRAYLARLGREGAERGWHFLTGSEESIRTLADEAGFRYTYNPATDLYAHDSGIMVLTPGGRLSRYFYGLPGETANFSASDLRLGLVDASEGRIGTLADKVRLLCLQYDPTTGRYGVAIMAMIRIGGILTVLLLAAFLTVSIRRERRQTKDQAVDA